MLKNDEKMCTWSLFRLFLPLKPRMWHEWDDENWFNQRWGARNIVAKLKGLTCVYSPVIPLCRCASRGMIDSIVSAFFGRNNKPEKREKPDCEGLTTSLRLSLTQGAMREKGPSGNVTWCSVEVWKPVTAVLTGSSVKKLTPAPVLRATRVALP